MRSRNTIVANLAGLGLLLSISSSVTAQTPMATPIRQNTQFRRIEQPLGLKIGVVTGGVALIGLELWWFLFSKKLAQKAESKQGIQELTITVDGGYEPSRVVVKAGQPVRLNFFRKDPSSCLQTLLVPDFHIARELNLNQVTPVEFTPEKPGHYPFTCGMNMFHGVVEVEATAASKS